MTRDTSVVVATVVALNLLRVVSSVILTRLLAPEVFGVVGIIGSVAFVLAMISDLGFQAFVVRHRDGDDPRFLDVVWTIRLLRAAALTAALALLAGPIAGALDKPALAGLIAVSAAFFLLEGLSSLSLVTALRTGALLRLSVMELGVAVVQLAAAVVLAAVWRDAWSMVAATLVAGAAKLWLSYAVFPGSRRRWQFDRLWAAELWAFARFVTGSSIISMTLIQADKVVLARLLPLDALGLYILAGNLALAPLAFTSAYASRVLYPLYARVWRERPEDLPGVFYAARRRASALYMVGAGGLIGVAPLLVGILYDDRYAGAATYLRLLAVTPLFALAAAAANEALTASGRVRATFRASLVKLSWLAVAAPVGFLWAGPIGLVAAVGATEAAGATYGWFALHRIGLLRPDEELLLLGAGATGIALGWLANAKLGAALGV
jgi:O-antigen/teichoic acid export membrane protein